MVVSGERMAGGGRRLRQSVGACLEGAVADGRARGEGGAGGRALQRLCTTRLCAARGAAVAAVAAVGT